MKRKTKGMLAAAAALMCIFVASGCGKSGGGSDAANPASSSSGETAAQNSNSGAETIEKYIVMDGSRINAELSRCRITTSGSKDICYNNPYHCLSCDILIALTVAWCRLLCTVKPIIKAVT